jgi:hypothetical protein
MIGIKSFDQDHNHGALESKGNDKIAGPARVVASLATVEFVLTTAYTVPSRPSGTTTFPFLIGTKIWDRPVRKATNVGEDVELLVLLNKTDAVTFGPRVLDEVGVMVSEGKALTGRGGLEEGQDTMNDAARVNTSSRVRGTYMVGGKSLS